MKCIFLYNPNSGKGKIAKKLSYIEKRLRTRYDSVTTYAASGARDLENKIRESAEEGYDAVIFAGGDGTFNNVLHGAGDKKVQFGYIPAGTVNDVARSLGIPRSIRGALNVILKGHSETLDCMRVNGGNYAMYVAAAGAFTSATYNTPQGVKRALGALAYAFEAVRNNMKLDVFPVSAECGGQRVDTHAVLILVLNGKSVAGFPINKEGSMKDGKIEAVIIKQVQKPNFFRKIGAYFSVASLFIFGCKVKKKDIVFLKGDRISVSTDESVVWDFDGEEGIRGNVTVEVCPKSVSLFVPKNKNL